METTGIQEEEMFVQKEKLQCRNVHFFTILKTNHIITVLLWLYYIYVHNFNKHQ